MTATVPAQGLNNHLFKYEYDLLYELNKVTYPNVAPFNAEADSWTYDAIGNRLTNTVNNSTQTYTYQKIGSNPLNWQRLLSDGVNSYTYDSNGNTATKTKFTFTWNYDDRMTGITGTSSYSYDYQGRRSSKTVGTTTTYLYDGLNLIREGGASTADYVFGPGIDEPLAMSRGGQIYYYGVDGLGSAATVANSGGTVQNTYLYDAWGQTRTQTGTLANPFGYTAREFSEAGTLFYRARYYSSGVGRFLSEDPSEPRFFPNPYPYVGNDPIYWFDPSGLARARPPAPRPPSPTPTPSPTPRRPPVTPQPPDRIFPVLNNCWEPSHKLLFWATGPNPAVYPRPYEQFKQAFGALCVAARRPPKSTYDRYFLSSVNAAGNASGAYAVGICCEYCP